MKSQNNKAASKKSSSPLANLLKIVCLLALTVFSAWIISSGGKMTLSYEMKNNKDYDTVFEATSLNFMSYALSDVYKMPKVYILPRNNDPAPVPDASKFVKKFDDERQNTDGSEIDYYKDDTIEVKCWKEVQPRLADGKPVSLCFAEIWIQHPSQFRRKLVGDTISNKQLDYPPNIFKPTNGVVGMTSDYCAFRPFGTIIHYGEAKRTSKINARLDLLIVDESGNFSSMKDSDFIASDLYGDESVVFTFAFGPVLVDNYEVTYDKNKFSHYLVGELEDYYARTAIGQFGDDLHYLLCTLDTSSVSKGASALDIATAMKNKGVRFAYNLDGGQTGTLMFNGQIFNHVGYGGCREVSDVIYFASAIDSSNSSVTE